jgi:hypothetical protein
MPDLEIRREHGRNSRERHMMLLLLKRWRLLVALVAALAVTVTTATQAFAAEPGESSSWTNEIVNNNQGIQSPDTYSEARGGNTGALVQIFRGDDNHVWLAVNNGPVFNAGGGNNTTTTYVAPRVVYSNGWFYAFQTGTNNLIYWSRASDGIIGANTPSVSQSYNWSNWTAIGGDPATQQSVSVASAPSGLLMTWLGVDQNEMYSAWLPSGSDVFNATQVIPFYSNSAPVVTLNSWDNVFQLVYRGLLDNQVYLAEQILGQSTWYDEGALPGVTTPTSPTIASDAYGDTFISAVDFDGNIWFRASSAADGSDGWSQESAGEQTGVPVWISVIGAVFYAIATYRNTGGSVQWKQAWNANLGI